MAGFQVSGLDNDAGVIKKLKNGQSHVSVVGNDVLREAMKLGLHVTTESSVLAEAEIVVVAVPTPINESREPDLRALRAAAETIEHFINRPILVLSLSSTYPGSTRSVFLGQDPTNDDSGHSAFLLAHAPERLSPSETAESDLRIPRVLGALNALAQSKASEFLEEIGYPVHEVSSIEAAEATKMLENAYRLVNIAFANEFSSYALSIGLSPREIIEAAKTKPFGFQAFFPSGGIGGHCIPVDPIYLQHSWKLSTNRESQLISASLSVASKIPAEVVARIESWKESRPKKQTVLVLGLSYKENVADARNSPALPIVELLLGKGYRVLVHDPWIPEIQLGDRQVLISEKNLADAIESADLVLLLQHHREYSPELLQNADALIDPQGKTQGKNVI